MSRYLRPHMPGVVFHLTARIQCREPLLEGIEGAVVSMIRDGTSRSDARLVAYAVMPNHLHIVLQQGARRLSDYMQPVLRRVALLVRRSRAWEGHVFERRYHESACITADYLRNTITYVHLNALRATLASSIDAYEWCSQGSFCDSAAPDALSRIGMEDALRVFAAGDEDTLVKCAENYRSFCRWRMLMDARTAHGSDALSYHPPAAPPLAGGDEHWCRVYAPFVQAEAERRRSPPRRMDLRDLALVAMREVDPAMDLDDLRYGGASRTLVHVRKRVIMRATAAGHTGRAISRFLHISPATVSSVRTRR